MHTEDQEWINRKTKQFCQNFVNSLPYCRMGTGQLQQFLHCTDKMAKHTYLFDGADSLLGKYLFEVDCSPTKRHLMGCNATFGGASTAMQEYRRVEFYTLGLWARHSLLQWRLGINIEQNLKSWVTFERVCGSARGFSFNEKMWISHGRYPAMFQRFCVSFCKTFGYLDPISWSQGPTYNADHFQFYCGANMVATSATQSQNIDADMRLMIHGTAPTTNVQGFLNYEGKLVLFNKPMWSPSLLLDSLMRLNGALQQAVGGSKNGLYTWRSMLMAMHAAMDFMATVSLMTINAIARSAIPGLKPRSREDLFGEMWKEFTEGAQLVTLACSGFTLNHHRVITALCIWALYGGGKSAAITMLENDEVLPFRIMVPESMFGLVGSDLFEVTVGKGVWWDKLQQHLHHNMMRSYYQKTSREKMWEWIPTTYVSGNEFCGQYRIYIWAPPLDINHHTMDTINGRYVNDCNFMILGFDLLGAVDLRSDGTLHKVLEGQMYNGCVIGTTLLGFTTILTQTQQLYFDIVGTYRNSNYLRPQQAQLIPFSIEYNQHRAVIMANNSIFHSGFVNELPGMEGLRKIDTNHISNNPSQVLLLMDYIIDSNHLLTWSTRLSFTLQKFVCRCRCRHNAWIDLNPWLIRRHFDNHESGWVDNLTFLWTMEWVDPALFDRYDLYLRRCNRQYMQRYRSSEALLENFLKEDVVQIFYYLLGENQQEPRGIRPLATAAIVDESPSIAPRRRLLQRSIHPVQ